MPLIQCVTEDDYEKFTLLFLRNRSEFADGFSFIEALGSIYTMLSETHILLIMNDDSDVIGAASYSYGTRECHFKDRHIVFIDCVLLEKKYRKSHFFIRHFLELIRHLISEGKHPKEIHFHAYRHDQYVHRLYKKFANPIAEKEDDFGIIDIFSVTFDQLVHYLKQFKRIS